MDDDDNSNSNNDNEHALQEQKEEGPLPLPLTPPQLTILLTPEGQKIRSILDTKPEELPLCVINNSNELLNDIAAAGELLPLVNAMSADDLFVRDAEHRLDERPHQQDDEQQQQEEEEQLQPQIVLLTPEGQQVRSLLEKKPDELPQSVINEINKLLNDIAAAGDFLPKVRTSIFDDLFCEDKEQRRQEQQQQQRGLTTTIIDKEEWPKEEKRYETALRLFPNIILEKYRGYYPIQWMAMKRKDSNYTLRLVSLIPLIVKLGIKLQLFDEEERGGLLSVCYNSVHTNGWNPLQFIISYTRDKHTTNATDECFSAVVERLRKENLFMKEDIQQYYLSRTLCVIYEEGYFLESQVQCIVDMDPMILSLPCVPENGNWLPIHWSTNNNNKDSQQFIFLLKEGLKYFPEKFGFLFSEGTQQQNGQMFPSTPFQKACRNYGRENVMDEIMNHIPAEYRSITPISTTSTTATTFMTTTTTTTTTTEISLLISAVTDESIHIDCLYILLRNDITAGLLRLQRNLQHQQLEEGDGQTVAKDNTDIDNIYSNNEESTGDSTMTSTSSSLENIIPTAAAATRTVSSPTTNKNNKNKSGASNNDNNTDASSSISTTTGPLAATTTADTAIVVVSSTTMNHNFNNNDGNYNHNNYNVTHHQPSSSSFSVNGKQRKRKQHEM